MENSWGQDHVPFHHSPCRRRAEKNIPCPRSLAVWGGDTETPAKSHWEGAWGEGALLFPLLKRREEKRSTR